MTFAFRWGRVLLLAWIVSVAAVARADGFRISGTAGMTSTLNQTYFTLGGRLGYDVAFGLTPEIGASYWMGGTPSIFSLSPGVTWYMPLPRVRPYVGAFYSHEFFSGGFPDQDALGARGGIAIFGAGPLSVNVGVAYKRQMSCSVSCDTWWPEASAGLS